MKIHVEIEGHIEIKPSDCGDRPLYELLQGHTQSLVLICTLKSRIGKCSEAYCNTTNFPNLFICSNHSKSTRLVKSKEFDMDIF